MAKQFKTTAHGVEIVLGGRALEYRVLDERSGYVWARPLGGEWSQVWDRKRRGESAQSALTATPQTLLAVLRQRFV